MEQPANPPDGAATPDMTFEQFEAHVRCLVRAAAFEPWKRELSVTLFRLPQDKLAGVFEIIKGSPPHVGGDDDEVVFDIDALDHLTLWKLDTYAKDHTPGGTTAQRNQEDYNKLSLSEKLEYLTGDPRITF